jgi:hypothetical protein
MRKTSIVYSFAICGVALADVRLEVRLFRGVLGTVGMERVSQASA